MSAIRAIILGIVQGLTEFLPISSSGHLEVVPRLLGWNDFAGNPSLDKAFDVALHFGTLFAAVAYFRRDIVRYTGAVLVSLRRRSLAAADARIGWFVGLATLPALAVGAIFEQPIEEHLGAPILVGLALIVFGLVLAWADRRGGQRPLESLTVRDALVVGVAQAVALQPGVSRSGITMTAGRFLDLGRETAARLSFLMLIPVAFGAAVYKGVKLFAVDGGVPAEFRSAFVWGILASAVSGFAAIWGLLRYLRTRSFMPFVVYRLVVGTAIIVVFASGLR